MGTVRAACAALSVLLLSGCPEKAPPGYDPSRPQPIDPSLRKAPPPGALPPNVPPPPPELGRKDDGKPPEPAPAAPVEGDGGPAPAAEAPPLEGDGGPARVAEAPPVADAPPPDASPPGKEDLAAHFVLRLQPEAGAMLTLSGDPRGATVSEVHEPKGDRATLKLGKLNAKEVQALLAALDARAWWKLPPAEASGPGARARIERGTVLRTLALGCPKCTGKGCKCPAAAVGALLRDAAASHLKDAPATQVLKFKPPGATKKKVPERAHCTGRDRPGYFTCVHESGPVEHCLGRSHNLVCYQSPYDAKGFAVMSDSAVDEKQKAAPPDQPWAIELADERCVRNDGRWSCEKGTELSRVTMGKTWLAWSPRSEPRPVKAGYAE